MKKNQKLCMAFSICSAILVLTTMTGCVGTLSFSNTIPGEYNLSGVSKIAMVGFNSLPSDPASGVYSADKSTRKIVEDMVATVFFKGKTYQIADLDVEKIITGSDKAGTVRLAHRFDALLYGRVWWKTSGEYKNITPHTYRLEKWYNKRYLSGRTNNGKPIYSTAKLTQTMTDVMREHRYRALNATLMFSVTLYRLNKDGKIEKIVEDFASADQFFLVNNGKSSTVFVPGYKVSESALERVNKQTGIELEAVVKANQEAGGIPTSLQTKMMLGEKLANTLSKKMTPSEVAVTVKTDFSIPEELFKALKAGKFADVRKQLVTMIRTKTGYAIAERIGSLSAYEPETVTVAKDPECIKKAKEAKKPEDKKEYEEEIAEIIEDTVDEFEDELYALAICEEACRNYDYALETYRCLLKYSAEAKYARGISRCLISMDMADRVQQTRSRAKTAHKKASLK